jgi:hypothetical protein
MAANDISHTLEVLCMGITLRRRAEVDVRVASRTYIQQRKEGLNASDKTSNDLFGSRDGVDV